MLAPRATVRLDGVAEIEKSAGLVMVSVTFAEWTTGPLAALIVSVYVPTGVAVVVDTFIVVDPVATTDAGANDAVAPAGRPTTLNATVPVNPLPGATVAA